MADSTLAGLAALDTPAADDILYVVTAGGVDKKVRVDRLGKVSHKRLQRVSGDLTLNNANWTNLDTGLDLALNAKAGDTIEVGVSGRFLNEGVYAYIDAMTLVAGAGVSWLGGGEPSSSTGGGVGAWFGHASQYATAGGSVLSAALGAGDIAAGIVTIRFRYRTDTGARTLLAQATDPLQVWAKNLGLAAA